MQTSFLGIPLSWNLRLNAFFLRDCLSASFIRRQPIHFLAFPVLTSTVSSTQPQHQQEGESECFSRGTLYEYSLSSRSAWLNPLIFRPQPAMFQA
jgi:hypothetical protein